MNKNDDNNARQGQGRAGAEPASQSREKRNASVSVLCPDVLQILMNRQHARKAKMTQAEKDEKNRKTLENAKPGDQMAAMYGFSFNDDDLADQMY